VTEVKEATSGKTIRTRIICKTIMNQDDADKLCLAASQAIGEAIQYNWNPKVTWLQSGDGYPVITMVLVTEE